MGPAIRQERNNARGTDEGNDRPKRAQDAKPRAPIAKENERAEDRFGRPEEEARAANAEGWEQPEDDRAMADQGDQHLSGVLAPLLDAEGEERKNHRGTNQMTVKTAPKRGGLRNITNKLVQLLHNF